MNAAATTSARHYLTIVFSDLSGSTRIASAMEPESYAELLGHLRELFETIVPRHGGEIIRIDGDGVLCIFGRQASYEDAGRRAVEAAIDLHGGAAALDQAFAPPGVPVRLHTGIHSGIVLLRSGDLVRGRFEVLGDATNVAARLCDLTHADGIVVSEETLGADRNFFQTGLRRHIDFEGRLGRVAVFDIQGRETTETRFAARVRRGVAPFAGRSTERDRIAGCLTQCTTTGAPQIAFIIGQAGIGKTRLSNESLDAMQAQGVSVYRGYCEAYLGAHPLQPLVQIVRSVVAGQLATLADPHVTAAEFLERLSPEHAPALSRMLLLDDGTTPQPPLQIDAAIAAVRVLIEHISTDGPIVLFVDDWQWTDDASRRMLEVLHETVKAPVLFLLASRSLDTKLARAGLAAIIEVPPLAASEATTAIQGLLDTADPFLIDRICDYAGGSPLFIEELCHARLGGDDILGHADRANWLDTLIQSRFARLSGDHAELVKTASVIGHIIPKWLFEALSGLPEGDRALDELAVNDFIYPGDVPGTLRFKHGITRDAIYRAISLRERQALHHKVVAALHARTEAMREDELFEPLAHHYAACGNADRALHYGLLAGGKALAASALDRAQALYRAALDALATLESSPERARQANEITQKYGLSCVFDPSPEQLPVLHRLATLAQQRANTEGLVLAQFWLGVIHYGLGNAKPSIAHLERAVTLAPELGNVRLLNQIRANLGQSHLAAAHCEIAAQQLDAVIADMSASGRDGRFSGLPYALCCRGFLFADQGDFDAAARLYAQVDILLDGTEPPMFGSYITQAAAVAIWKGDFVTATRAAERGIALAERTRSRYFMMMSRALRAYASWCATRDASAVDDLVHASQWFLSGASQQRSSLLFGWLAEIMAEQGDVERARFYAAKAWRRGRTGDRLGEATAARAMAKLAAAGHGPRSVDHYLAVAHRFAGIRGSAREAALTNACAMELAPRKQA